MHSRLVPAVVVVLLLTSPLVALPVGAVAADDGGATGSGAASGSTTASGGGSAAGAPTASNNTTTVPGSGVVLDVATVADGGSYLAGANGRRATNLTLTRLAPNGSVRWQRTVGGPADSRRPVAVASGPDQSAYVLELVGPVRSTPPADHSAPESVRLTRVAGDGSVLWTRSLGNATRVNRVVDLVAPASGGAVLARPTGTDAPGTRLQRVARDGDLEWTRTYAGGVPRALASVPSGGYVLAGEHDYREAWLLRVDADGAVRMNETYGTSQRRVAGVVPTDDGGALLAGSAETRGFSGTDPWVARVTPSGEVTWSRTYGTTAREYPRTAVATDRGVLLVHGTDTAAGRGTRLTHVTADGAAGSTTLSTDRPVTAAWSSGEHVRLYGVEYDRRAGSVTGTVRTVALPTPTPDPLSPHAGAASDRAFYRGQNLRLTAHPNTTYGLYRLPGEYTDHDEPVRVRRLAPGEDGTDVFETATLSTGTYAVRSAPGFWLRLEDGEVTGLTENASATAFELSDLDVWRAEPNRTVVETHDGERAVRVHVEADAENFTARVGLVRSNGSSVDRETLGAALAADSQSTGPEGVFTEDGRTYGTVELSSDRNVTLDAGALPAGLYELSVTGLETADGSEPATTQLVVVHEERPVSLTPDAESLTVPANGSATANLTLSGVTEGIGALRLEANQSGRPPLQLRLEFTDAVEYRSASGGGGISPRRSTAEVQSLDVRDAPNGTFTVAELSVERADFGHETDAPAPDRTTVTVGVGWIVDEDGVPYSVPEDSTVTVEFEDEA